MARLDAALARAKKLEFGPGPMEVHHTCLERLAALEAENVGLRGLLNADCHKRQHFEFDAQGTLTGYFATALSLDAWEARRKRIAENDRLRVKLDSMPEHKRVRECHYKAPCLECEAQDVRDDLRHAMGDVPK